MRLDIFDDEKIEIDISPLIDCVFLLLIFFLVTTMMRKSEMQIPLSLPSITSSLSSTKSFENTIVIALDEDAIYQSVNHNAYTGQSSYLVIDDLKEFLNNLRAELGVDINIEIAAFRTVPVDRVIEVFDICQLQGFTQTNVRLGGKPY